MNRHKASPVPTSCAHRRSAIADSLENLGEEFGHLEGKALDRALAS